MIIESIFDILKVAIIVNMQILPKTNISIPSDVGIKIAEIISGVKYFLPVKDLGLMLLITLLVTNWWIIWKSLQRIWDALPFT